MTERLKQGWCEVGKAVLAVFCAIVVVRAIFFVTYPPNSGGDCIGYYRMLVEGKSNLVHAPGYPFLVGLPVRGALWLTGRQWMISIHPVWTEYAVILVQHAISFLVLLYLFVTVRKVFGRGTAILTVLVHGLRPSTLGFVSCFYPEWFQADLLVVTLCTIYWAFAEVWGSRKVLLYAGASTAFAWCYLTKYNALFILPVLVVVPLCDRIAWRRKAIVAAVSALVVILQIGAFVWGFHRPSTGTVALSRDHAWVLLTSLGRWAPDGELQPEAGVNTKRLIYLNSVLPWEPGNAGPYWHVDQTPPSVRAPWRERYLSVLSADEGQIDKLLRDVPPQPRPYDFFTAFLPVSWYLGLEEGDRLGTHVFVEHAVRYPGKYARYVASRMGRHLWSWPSNKLYPTDVVGPQYGQPDKLGFCRREQIGDRPNNACWYTRPVIWKPGVVVTRWLGYLYRLPSLLVALLVAGYGAVCVARVWRGNRDAGSLAGVVLGMVLVVYFIGSNLIFFRWKEAQTILPVVSVLFAAAVMEVVATVRERGKG